MTECNEYKKYEGKVIELKKWNSNKLIKPDKSRKLKPEDFPICRR